MLFVHGGHGQHGKLRRDLDPIRNPIFSSCRVVPVLRVLFFLEVFACVLRHLELGISLRLVVRLISYLNPRVTKYSTNELALALAACWYD